MLQGLLIGWINLGSSGNSAPLPYLPLANPADLASLFGLLCAWHWLRYAERTSPPALAGLGAAGFLISTFALLRAMHQLAGVPWQLEAMIGSVLVQAALSVYWGTLGFGAMVWGARRGERVIWMIGAGLMAVVVAKLFFVELGNTGTVARIVSFIAVGALLLVVGYLAPAPPRRARPSGA